MSNSGNQTDDQISCERPIIEAFEYGLFGGTLLYHWGINGRRKLSYFNGK